MKNKLHPYSILLIITAFMSCNDLNLQTADDNVPVIEAYISPAQELSVKVFKQLSYSSQDTNYTTLNNLNIILSDSVQEYVLIPSDSGVYTNSSVAINPGEKYNIAFEYNNKLVDASTIIPYKPEGFSTSSSTIEVFSFSGFDPSSGGPPPERPEPITLSWNNTSNEYHMIVVENIEEDPLLINSGSNRPKRVFRNAPTIGSSQEIDATAFTYYGRHQVILYKLNAEYAALYEQLGSSSLDIVAPPSNVNNGLGIFTGINSDTLYVNVSIQD